MDNSQDRSGSEYADYSDELPVIVRGSEVLNLAVMDRGTMQAVGRVERLWMYPQAHRILGLICKGGGLLGKQRWAYKLPQIESLNSNNLWVGGLGTATSPDQIRQLETLIDHEIWVDGGDRLGVIVDCLFNRKTGQITQYLFVNNRLRQLIDASNPLRPEEILSFGNQRVLVSSQAVTRLRRERPSLRDTLSQMKEQARGEYEQVTNQTQERVRSWGEEAKTAKERLAEQAALLKQQAAERAKILQEQASQEILPQISEQAQGLGQRMGQQYHAVQRRAQDFIEELPPLEQLSEEVRSYGRTRDPHGDRSQDYDSRDYDSRDYDSQGYNSSHGRDSRDRHDWDVEHRPQAALDDSLGHDAHAEDDSDYRQSRRSRYRRDNPLQEHSDERSQEFGRDRADEPPSYGYDPSSAPSSQHPFRENIAPDEMTWVDEVEDFSSARPSTTQPDAEASSQGGGAMGGRFSPGQHGQAPEPSISDPSPSSSSIPAAQSASRDNPWGYADSATDSDWDDLEFTSAPPDASVERALNDGRAETSIPVPPDAVNVDDTQELAAEFTNAIAPEDLEDDDPWI